MAGFREQEGVRPQGAGGTDEAGDGGGGGGVGGEAGSHAEELGLIPCDSREWTG